MGNEKDGPKPPAEKHMFTAKCKPGPVYVYRSFLASPNGLIWRSAIRKVRSVMSDNGQWVGYPEIWDLVIDVEGGSPQVISNFSESEAKRLETFLKGWLVR